MSSPAETNRILKAIVFGWLFFSLWLFVYFGLDELIKAQSENGCIGLPSGTFYLLVAALIASAVLCFRKVPVVYPGWQRGLMTLICTGLCYTSYVLVALTHVLYFAKSCDP